MQIKKCRYLKYNEQKELIAEGYCYRFFWHRWTAKGFGIPFTRVITSQKRVVGE